MRASAQLGATLRRMSQSSSLGWVGCQLFRPANVSGSRQEDQPSRLAYMGDVNVREVCAAAGAG